MKGSGALTPPWTGRARLPGSTAIEEAAAEERAAAIIAPRAALGAAAASAVAALAAEVKAAVAPIRPAIDDAIGRAVAAVLLDKPVDAVTREEALAALANPFAKRDPERTNRAIRAGMRAMAMKLESHLVDPGFAGLLVGVTKRLDAGEWRNLGWATPAKTTRRGLPGVRAEEALWFTVEIAFLRAAYDVSLDKAIGTATGVWRLGTGGRNGRPAALSGPTMPARAGWGRTTIQKIIRLGEKNDPERIADARREGKSARTGEVSLGFFTFRLKYLSTWAARLQQDASRVVLDGKRRRGTPRRK